MALVPLFPGLSQSPSFVYPIMIFVGKEEEIDVKAKKVIDELNNLMSSMPTLTVTVTTDLKSFWVLTNGRFKYDQDCFCPFCCCKKGEIEAVMRGRKTAQKRSGNIGSLKVDYSMYCFCWLHAKMRLTETILRQLIRSYYSKSRNKQAALNLLESKLRAITGNNQLRVKIPKEGEGDKKYGNVQGLTGGMIQKILDGKKELMQFAPEKRKSDILELWTCWDDIVNFVEENVVPTKALQTLLKCNLERFF
jgi:hypothetical protein